MRLAQFKTKTSDQQLLGILIGDVVCDVSELARAAKRSGPAVEDWLLNVNSTLEVIKRGAPAFAHLGALMNSSEPSTGRAAVVAHSLDSIDFLPAVYPGKILAIGRNYAEHAAEGGSDLPKAPMLFNKLPNAPNAHGKSIVLPSISTQVDFEAELAVIIGRRAKQVSEAEALDDVFGYSLINDVSAR